MAKEKSLKLRTILSICALYKYSDRKHRLTPRTLNGFLRPFGLRMSGVGLADDIRILREFGVDAHTNEGEQVHSAYIGDHLFSEDTLRKLIYEVSTNPNLSKLQATDILRQFLPLVTVYQERYLQSFTEHDHAEEPDDTIYWMYSVVKEAIHAGRRINYTRDYAKYNSDTQEIDRKREWETLFTPKHLCKVRGKLYAVGYNNSDNRPECVPLEQMASVRLSLEYKTKSSLVQEKQAEVSLHEHIPRETSTVLYEGPAVFRCFASNIGIIYDLFGEPTGPVEQAYNYRTTYPVAHVVLTTEALTKLAELSRDGGLHIVAPQSLRAAVSAYYKSNADTLTSKKFPRRSSNGRE